jgi:DNA polymerase-1
VLVNLIDVSGFIYRSFYGLPHFKFEDIEIGAVFGFCSEMLKLKTMFEKSMFIAIFDSAKITFRNTIYEKYKANRTAMPSELVSQICIIKEAADAFGFIRAELLGYEADDLIASYTKNISSTQIPINIISSDKDLLQLLNTGKQIRVFDPAKNDYITEKDVFVKFGVDAHQLIDLFSLMGDSSDNVPGVPGIGPKTAAILITEFGCLENLIANLNKLPNTKKYEILRQNIDQAVLAKKLITLQDGLEIQFEYQENKPSQLINFLNKYKFKSLIHKATQFI